MRFRFLTAASVVVCVSCSTPSLAQTGANVLVVANETVPGSLQVAEEYLTARRIPTDQLVRVNAPATEQVSFTEFDALVQTPIARWLAAHSAQDRILYIVLAKGVPLLITGSKGRQGTSASVDSELAMLYRRLTGNPVPLLGPVANPYFARTPDGLKSAKPFSRAANDTYLVTRLDGFSVADAIGLVKRAVAPATQGRILLDAPLSSRDLRLAWIEDAAARLREAGLGDRVLLETTGHAIQNETDVLGYVSWGSNDPALYVRHPNLSFVPGALATMFLSSDARTFSEPPATWKPGPAVAQNLYSGSSQTLVADLIRSGVTGVAGQTDEPYLDGAVRPDILFPAYVKGFNLGESFYLSTPYLSWRTVVVGDPLCAPFGAALSRESEPEPPLDADTELPARFAARRLEALTRLGSPAVLKLVLRSEARTARGDDQGALEALSQAVALDSSSRLAWRAFADAHERLGNHAEASAAYRRIVALEPNDVVALNNLAYNLAIYQNQPQEAYPLAERAAALARNSPMIDDTLGWIQHLLGDDAHAVVLLERASRALPRNGEVQLHAAVVFAKVGRLDDAAKALALAGQLDPKLKERSEFRELQRTIGRD